MKETVIDNYCGTDVAIAYPDDLIKESQGYVIALYVFVAIVLLTCMVLQIK